MDDNTDTRSKDYITIWKEQAAAAKLQKQQEDKAAAKLAKYELKHPVTFGNVISQEQTKHFGFVYLVTITAGWRKHYYVGSKAYDAAGKWRSYITSSVPVQKLIKRSFSDPTIKVQYSVIQTDCWCKSQLLQAESKAIHAYYNRYKDQVLNIRDAHGISLRTGQMIAFSAKSAKSLQNR